MYVLHLYVLLCVKLKLVVKVSKEPVFSLCHFFCLHKSRCNESLDPLGKKVLKTEKHVLTGNNHGKYTCVPCFDNYHTYIITTIYV